MSRARVAEVAPAPAARASQRRLFATLYWWRLRHIAQAAYRLAMRRWQALLLLLLVFSPRDMPVLQQLRILSDPVLVLTSPGSPATVLTLWIVLLAIAQAWVHVQGEVLAGGPAWAFAQAQPLPPGLARRVDLAVLAVGDLPLFLPFIAALFVLPPASPAQRMLQAAAIVVAAAQLPLVQWLAPRRPAIAAVLAATQMAGLTCIAMGLSPMPFLAGTVAADLFALRRADAPVSPRGPRAALVRSRAPQLPASAPMWLRLAWIDLRSLFEWRRLLDRLSLLAPMLLPWVTREFLALSGVRPQVVTVVVVFTLMPLVFKVSSLAFELRRLHEPMRPLHASLGIPARLVRWVDAGVLLAIFLPAAMPLVMATWSSRPAPAALAVLPCGALALLACVILNQRGDRGVFLPKVLACGAAVGASLLVMHA
jgi:hypothetical protein